MNFRWSCYYVSKERVEGFLYTLVVRTLWVAWFCWGGVYYKRDPKTVGCGADGGWCCGKACRGFYFPCVWCL